jgi:hypothetical protein
MGTTINRIIRVTADEVVELKITIHFGQLGSTAIYLDAEKQLDETDSKISVSLGKGKDLRRKELRCSTMVQDVNTKTNKTAVTYKLSGGRKPYEEKLQKTVVEDGEIAWYTATFNFY